MELGSGIRESGQGGNIKPVACKDGQSRALTCYRGGGTHPESAAWQASQAALSSELITKP